MRIIDADTLIEDIKSFWDWDSIDGITATTVLKQTISDISHAPTIDAVPHWIPCEERLPEKDQLVLCQCRAGIIDVLRLKPNWFWENLNPYVTYMSGFVIAWMPLPEPYGGERKDNA